MLKEGDSLKKYLFYAIVFGLFIISYFIVKDFLIEVISALILAFLINPINKKIGKKMPRYLASLISVLALVTIIILTIFIFSNLLIKETEIFLQVSTPSQVISFLSKLPFSDIIIGNLDEIKKFIGSYLLLQLPSVASFIPSFFIKLLITFFITYYFLVDWDNIKRRIVNILPFDNKNEFVKKVEKTTSEIVNGMLIIAIILAIVATIGFYLLGMKLAILLGILTGLSIIIPVFGPFSVWGPIFFFELIKADYFLALEVLALGLILNFAIDWFLKIKILHKKSEIHPIIMLLGVVGGVKLLGIIGFVVGPILLSVTISFIETISNYKKKR